jgi:hypothetical protein
MMDNENEMAYVALCKCGGLVMATMDRPDRRKDAAREVAKCIRLGYAIKRMTADEVRALSWCKNNGECQGAAEPPDPRQMELIPAALPGACSEA